MTCCICSGDASGGGAPRKTNMNAAIVEPLVWWAGGFRSVVVTTVDRLGSGQT
jgi:hypothetical protein